MDTKGMVGVEIHLDEPDDFLKIKETLTRIGICSFNTKTLYQSVHILFKQGRYYLVHFKEMFMLDGKPTNFSDEDKDRRNIIVNLLQEWGLFKIVGHDEMPVNDKSLLGRIKIIPFKDKSNWNLTAKYSIGTKK